MPYTQVQIISNALALLGKAPIQSLADQSQIAAAAVQAYYLILPQALSVSFWRFATVVVQLSQLPTPPPVQQWAFAYKLPADYLKLVRQYPHNYAYQMYANNVMWSNIPGPLALEYISSAIPETNFPPYFVNYLAYAIANYLALSSAQKVDYAQFLATMTQQKLDIALAADAANRPQFPLQSSPVLQNRFIGAWTQAGIPSVTGQGGG